MNKKVYERMSVTPFTLNCETALLAGSLESANVLVQNVSVEDYSYGFTEGGSEIGFEVGFGE